MEDMIIAIALILAVSFLFSELFYRLKYPRVIGQILAGIILGLPIFSAWFTPSIKTGIEFLADLGIIFLLLLAGLELNLDKFRKAKKDSLMVGLFCVSIPFLLGFVLIKAFGYSNITAFIVGACLSITAEGTTLKVLIDMRALNTKIGTIIVGAGILDDIMGIIFLSIVSFNVSGNITELALFPVKFLVFVALANGTYKIFPMGLRRIEKEHSTVSTFSFILLFGIIIAIAGNYLGIGTVVGSFVAGVIIHLSEHKKGEHHETVKELRVMTFSLIVPFFFIYIGLQFHEAFAKMIGNIWLSIMILFIASTGKVFGAILAKPFTDLTIGQAHLIGWGMNSRGLIELVVAQLAYEYNLIPPDLFGAIIAAGIITTLLFPAIMKTIVKQDRNILRDSNVKTRA